MIKIVSATLNHLEPLSKLFDAYRVFYRKKPDLVQATEFIRERIINKESIIFLAIDGQNNPIGFVQLYPLFSSTKMKRLWLLNDLYVSPEFRGQNISKSLIEEAKKWTITTNACGLLLETEKTNLIGNNLYPKVDFKINTTTNYYEWSNPNEV